MPFPSPGGLPNPGSEPKPPASQADSLLSEPPGKPTAQTRRPLGWLHPERGNLSCCAPHAGPGLCHQVGCCGQSLSKELYRTNSLVPLDNSPGKFLPKLTQSPIERKNMKGIKFLFYLRGLQIFEESYLKVSFFLVSSTVRPQDLRHHL